MQPIMIKMFWEIDGVEKIFTNIDLTWFIGVLQRYQIFFLASLVNILTREVPNDLP